MMKRRVWITASLAALFGLQGSLCALACLESASPELASQQPAAAMPCHGTPADPIPTPALPDSEAGCSCDASVVALNEEAGAIPTNVWAGDLLQAAPPVVALRAVSTSLQPEAAEQLPAPDILLLKSTLLI